ncbi:MAG: hypothetical protein JXR94_13960, partial [Candidatus Hydrogenedentes bacterium]|nr:hypothetical protein [Candidatus Hydrogenedentota bacterium]
MRRIVLSAVVMSVLAVCAYGGSGSGDSPIGLIDTRGPEFASLAVDPSLATPGDTVTITFSVSEPLAANPVVRVNSNIATFVSEVGGVYTYIYTIGMFDPSGPAEITIEGADVLGNPGDTSASDLLTLDVPPLPLRTGLVLLVLLAVALFTLRRLPKASAALFLGALVLAPAASGQDPTVSNVQFVQQPAASGGTEVVITYDLDSPLEACYVTVWLSKDGGTDGFPFPAISVTGDLTDVETGTGHTVVWDVARDYPNEYIPEARIRVTATTGERDYSPWEACYPAYIVANSAKCQNNLKQVGLVLKMFYCEAPGEVYPRLSDEPGRLMFREDEIYGEYLFTPETLNCPGRADEEPPPFFDDDHYVHLGYLLRCDEDATAFAAAYTAEALGGGDFSANLPATTSYGSVVYRLRCGIERFVVTDINDTEAMAQVRQETPVMFDWPDNHQAGWGGNVLYLDGHVEFVDYGQFPMTDTTIGALAGLAGYVPPTEWRSGDPVHPYTPTGDPYGFVAECDEQLRQVGMYCAIYANESAGEVFPPLSAEAGRLMFPEESVYPDCMTNPGLLVCPGPAPATPAPYFDDRDYVYLGYVLTCDDDVAAFAAAYAAELAGGGDFSGDLPGPVSYGSTILRLRDNIEDFLTVDVSDPATLAWMESRIPVMLEWPDNHEGLCGGHVLYLDGHREWHDYPGEFPMTEATVGALGALAGRTAKAEWAEPCPAYTEANDPYGFCAACRNQCVKIGLALRTFSNDDVDELLPMLSDEPGRLMFTEDEVHCEYLSDPDALICPGPAEVTPKPRYDDQHYVYLGYLVTCDEDVTGFAAAYVEEMAGTRDFSGDLPGTVSYGSTIYRLRDDVGRLLITDINHPEEGYVPWHEIPVLIEWPDHHEGLVGGHVLYLDGHVEWHGYPGEFPMTATTIGTLDALATWAGTTEWATKEFTRANDPYKQALCAHNLYSLGIMMKVFANHANGEVYPALCTTPGTLMFTAEETRPYFLHEPVRMNCPGSRYAFIP